jgi:hypothetical protein
LAGSSAQTEISEAVESSTVVQASPAPARREAWLLSITVFLSAFLVFLIEPMFAKMILPRFGGSAAVWATCLVFYQCALLLGYFYADVTSRRLPAARQSYLHIALLAVSFAFLPIAPRLAWQSGADPAWRILVLLAASIGLPFVLLSATSPLLQLWYARRGVADPYHLFALSNFASFLALLSFPFLIEPRLSSHGQAALWSILFAGFAALCARAAWVASKHGARSEAEPATSDQLATPRLRDRFLWLSAAACGSMLLLSVTNHLLENVAPVPLLWILPLAVYLLSFTMAFHRRRLYSPWLMARFLAVALGGLSYAIYDASFAESVQISVPFFCIGLFVCCLFCHGELALRRPAAPYLTSYYLMVALGGAVGAIFVGLLAPHIFTGIYEFPIALVFTAALAMAMLWRQGLLARIFWVAAASALVFVTVRSITSYQRDTIVRMRSFYGPLRVKQFSNWLKEPYRTLYNGKIEHGAQYVDAPSSLLPTTYYAPESGIGFALEHCCSGGKRVGVIGLGAGTLAAYGQIRDYFRFYEINPQIAWIARNSFTYLRDSPAKIEVVMGDARLSLESEASQEFDVLAVDAFSGDAIPVHLLTKQAFSLYLRHLKPDGILAIHTSNTYLNLPPVVQLLANDALYPVRLIGNSDNRRKLVDSSDWVLITRNKRFLDDLDTSIPVDTINVPPHLRLWTDDYNNLFQILQPIRFSQSTEK